MSEGKNETELPFLLLIRNMLYYGIGGTRSPAMHLYFLNNRVSFFWK